MRPLIRMPGAGINPLDFEPTTKTILDAFATSPARDGATADAHRLADRTTMEPTHTTGASNRNHSLEFGAWNSSPRIAPHLLHESTPFGTVRSANATESLIDGGMGELVANDLFEEGRRSIQ